MVLLHNVLLCNVRETGGNLWDKSQVFWKLFLKKKKKKKNNNDRPSSPATNQNRAPLEGGFSITRFCPQANLEKVAEL